MSYKGNEIEVNKIPPNTAVEIENPERFFTIYEEPLRRDPATGGYATVKVPSLGVLTSFATGGKPLVAFYVGGDEFIPKPVASTRALPAGTKFKVLTGTMGQKLEGLRQVQLFDNLPKEFHKPFPFSNGCDPEVFVEDGKGTWLPAWTFLPSKHDENKRYGYARTRQTGPHGYTVAQGALPVVRNLKATGVYEYNPDAQLCGEAYWDGAQAEFTVQPGGCNSTVLDQVHVGLGAILSAARKVCPTAKLSAKCVMHIPSQILSSFDPEFVQLGCDPSYNAYGERSPIPPEPIEVEDRPAGGHIHLSGWGKLDEGIASRYVKAMDKLAGVAFVGILGGFDDPARRKSYGRAGEFRLPPHGLEYRVLSNGWMRGPALAHLAFDLVRLSAHAERLGYLEYWKSHEDEVRAAINDTDPELARKVIRRNEKLFLALVEGMAARGALAGGPGNVHKDAEFARAALASVYEGVGYVYQKPDDLEFNWDLDGHFNWECHTEGDNCQWMKLAPRLLQGLRA